MNIATIVLLLNHTINMNTVICCSVTGVYYLVDNPNLVTTLQASTSLD